MFSFVYSHHVNFVISHGQLGAMNTASSHIELLQLQRHLEGEINRQDLLADATQKICIQDMRKIVSDLKKV